MVSVIMAAFNSEFWIADSIDSVRKQTYPQWKLYVVNDGSTDNTAGVVEKFLDDKRIQLINQENTGPAGARNCGIKRAQGEFLAFLDADDCWLPDKLAYQLKYLQSHPEVGLLHTAYRIFHEDPQEGKPFQDPGWFAEWPMT